MCIHSEFILVFFALPLPYFFMQKFLVIYLLFLYIFSTQFLMHTCFSSFLLKVQCFFNSCPHHAFFFSLLINICAILLSSLILTKEYMQKSQYITLCVTHDCIFQKHSPFTLHNTNFSPVQDYQTLSEYKFYQVKIKLQIMVSWQTKHWLVTIKLVLSRWLRASKRATRQASVSSQPQNSQRISV